MALVNWGKAAARLGVAFELHRSYAQSQQVLWQTWHLEHELWTGETPFGALLLTPHLTVGKSLNFPV